MSVEKHIESKLVGYLKKNGGLAIKLYNPFFTGLPDRLLLVPVGRVFFVELKSTGKKQSPRQRYVRNLLAKIGFTVYVLDTEQALQQFINDL